MRIILILFLGIGLIEAPIAGSCPDGSDPIKSISEDGTYFVFNCGSAKDSTSQTNDKTTSTKKRTFAKSPEIKSHSADLDIKNHYISS